jgi:hypothetical protein
MIPEQKNQLLELLRLLCKEANEELDEGGLAEFIVPIKKDGSALNYPIVFLK